MVRALFAGSFNPPTLGHLDIILRASALFGELTIGVAHHTEKISSPLLNTEQKISLLEKMTDGCKIIKVVAIPELVVNYAKKHEIEVLIRGVRTGVDYPFEMQMAALNREIAGLETLILVSDPKYSHLSSTLIRELGTFGQSLKGLVPDSILKEVESFFKIKQR